MRRSLITVLGSVLVVALSGCGASPAPPADQLPGGSTPAGPAATSSAAPAAKTADPPTVFDASAPVALPAGALRANMAGNPVSRFVTLRERTAYIVGMDSLSAVDVLTGQQRWTTKIGATPSDPHAQSGPFVNPVGPNPPVVDDAGTLVAAAVPTVEPEQGTTAAYLTMTVVAVDAATGKKAWESKARISDKVSGGGYGQGAITKVVAVTSKAIVASYHQDDSMTVALDPATGKTLWEREEYDAGGLNGDVLVGTDSNVAENSSMNQITALAVTTGEQRWIGATKSSALTVVPADPALVVVNRTDYGSGHPFLLFLDPATGAEKGKLEGEPDFSSKAYGDCLYDQQSVLVCTSDGVVTGYDAKTAKALWALPDQAAGRVAPASITAVWHGALYGKTQGFAPIVLDAKTGKDISTAPGATPYWVSAYAGIGVDDKGGPQAYPVKQ